MSQQPIHPAAMSDDALFGQCEMRRERRSGPGGQRRNKVETAVVLVHTPTGLTVEASDRRRAEDTRRVALVRLRLALARAVRRSPHAGGPSALWQSRCTGGRVCVSTRHADFPAILAEAIDSVAAHEFDLRAAAESLGCTMSQLKKLVEQDPPAWRLVQILAKRPVCHGLIRTTGNCKLAIARGSICIFQWLIFNFLLRREYNVPSGQALTYVPTHCAPCRAARDLLESAVCSSVCETNKDIPWLLTPPPNNSTNTAAASHSRVRKVRRKQCSMHAG